MQIIAVLPLDRKVANKWHSIMGLLFLSLNYDDSLMLIENYELCRIGMKKLSPFDDLQISTRRWSKQGIPIFLHSFHN